MTDDLATCVALLDELEQNAFTGAVRSALSAQERSVLLGRLTTLYALAAAEAGATRRGRGAGARVPGGLALARPAVTQ